MYAIITYVFTVYAIVVCVVVVSYKHVVVVSYCLVDVIASYQYVC